MMLNLLQALGGLNIQGGSVHCSVPAQGCGPELAREWEEWTGEEGSPEPTLPMTHALHRHMRAHGHTHIHVHTLISLPFLITSFFLVPSCSLTPSLFLSLSFLLFLFLNFLFLGYFQSLPYSSSLFLASILSLKTLPSIAFSLSLQVFIHLDTQMFTIMLQFSTTTSFSSL